MTKKRVWLHYLVIPAALLAVALLMDMFVFQYRLWRLPQEERGVHSVSWQMQKDTGELTIQAQDTYIEKLVLTLQAGEMAPYTIMEGDSAIGTYVANPEIARQTINVRDYVGNITIVFTDPELTISQVEVYNNWAINPYRAGLVFLTMFTIYLLFMLRGVIARRVEIGFLTVALLAGGAMAVMIPANVNMSWDDQIHFQNAYYGSFPGGNISLAENANAVANLSWSYLTDGVSMFHSFYSYEDQREYYRVLDSQNSIVGDMQYSWSWIDVGYLPQAMMLWLGRLLRLSFHVQFILGRVGNLLLYTGVCYWAVSLALRHKTLLSAVMLMPTPLFLAASYSYDPTVSAFFLLGMVLLFNELYQPKHRLSAGTACLMLVAFIIGSLPKPVYIVLALAALALPVSKFKSRRQMWQFRAGVLLVCALVAATFLLPTILGVTDYSDPRGGDTSVAGQIRYILHAPQSFAKTLIQSIWESLGRHLLHDMRVSWAYLGNIPTNMDCLSLLLLLGAFFTDTHVFYTKERELGDLSKGQKWYMALVLVGTLTVIWTALYLVYNPVGSSGIGGVQGRYYLPLVIVLIMTVQPRKLLNQISPEKYHFLIFGGYALVLFVSMFSLVIRKFWF